MDRDPRFTSARFKEFFTLTGVHLHFTTGYKSQSNGLSEAANMAVGLWPLLREGLRPSRLRPGALTPLCLLNFLGSSRALGAVSRLA
jgi:hypothetical protein